MTGTLEQRLAAVAQQLVARVPPDLWAESETLIGLDPDVRGLRVVYEPEHDRYAFLWVGRWLGSVDGRWLREGTVPDDTP